MVYNLELQWLYTKGYFIFTYQDFDFNRIYTVLLYLNAFKNNTHSDQLVRSRTKILEHFQYTLVYLLFINSLKYKQAVSVKISFFKCMKFPLKKRLFLYLYSLIPG